MTTSRSVASAPAVDRGDRRRGIITPEAVVLEFDTASVPSRLLARLVDALVLLGLLIAYGLLISTVSDGRSTSVAFIVVTIFVWAFVLLGYWMVLETVWGGRTVGKAAVGLRVVTIEGAPVQFRHSAIRAMLGLIDFFLPPLGPVAMVVVGLSPSNQRLGDMVAGTIVLRERTAIEPAQAVSLTMPPGEDDMVAALQLAPISDQHYALVRRFLLRAHMLSPVARSSLANELAGRLAIQMGVAKKPGLHPEWFLHAVGIAYQRRTGGVIT